MKLTTQLSLCLSAIIFAGSVSAMNDINCPDLENIKNTELSVYYPYLAHMTISNFKSNDHDWILFTGFYFYSEDESDKVKIAAKELINNLNMPAVPIHKDNGYSYCAYPTKQSVIVLAFDMDKPLPDMISQRFGMDKIFL